MHYVKITHVIKLVLENFSIYLLLYIIFLIKSPNNRPNIHNTEEKECKEDGFIKNEVKIKKSNLIKAEIVVFMFIRISHWFRELV